MLNVCRDWSRLLDGESLDARMHAGRTAGFDYVRIGLAISVVCIHGAVTSHGPGDHALWTGFYRPLAAMVLPMFFALSGFLVTGSLLRAKSLTEFALLRALRIVPALFVEVMIAALVLGPLLTNFPLRDYFTDPKFLTYPLNIVGDIHYRLPGLFLANPDADMVNRQLWTIPSELRCYFALLILGLLGFVRGPKRMLIVLGVALVAFPAIDFFTKPEVWQLDTVPSKALILCFLSGVVFYLYKKNIRLNLYWFLASLALAYGLLLFRESAYLGCIPITYVVVYIGLSRSPKTILTATGDYSYGLYLYGYPIQQTYSYLFPDYRIPWLNILFSLFFGLLLAALSWHLVEARVLGSRKMLIPLFEHMIMAVPRTLFRPRRAGR